MNQLLLHAAAAAAAVELLSRSLLSLLFSGADANGQRQSQRILVLLSLDAGEEAHGCCHPITALDGVVT